MTNSDSDMRVLPAVPGVGWIEIRSAAVDFASHGWPVLPGTYQLAPFSQWLGKKDAQGLEPVMAHPGRMVSTTDGDLAREWWTRRPYSVLLSCGIIIDALEIPVRQGERALESLRTAGHLTPIVATPFGTWLIFVEAGTPLRPELAEHCQLHAQGRWVPLPPTSHARSPYQWQADPSTVGWSLARSGDVQEVLIDTLRPRVGGRHTLRSTPL